MNASDSHHQHFTTAEGRAILDALPAIAWCKQPDGSNEFVNRRWQDYTGMPGDEACGLGWQAAVHPDDLPKVTEKWAEIVASSKGGEFEGRLRRQDGVFRWCLARIEPVRDAAGEIVRWYGTSTDIDALTGKSFRDHGDRYPDHQRWQDRSHLSPRELAQCARTASRKVANLAAAGRTALTSVTLPAQRRA